MTPQHPALHNLETELTEVEASLNAAADELGIPLEELVRSRIRRSYPLVRAALILTVARGPETDTTLRSKRISLAGALEMLYVAMQVHQLLLGQGADTDPTQDRTLLGGAILAGDYCFSRAAQMAARTDNPQVVRLFAQTLQTVSEGQLRNHFDAGSQPTFDENAALLRAGAAAAAALVNLDAAASAQAADLAQSVIQHQQAADVPSTSPQADASSFPAAYAALHAWLVGRAA